jgi:hypothetical protein
MVGWRTGMKTFHHWPISSRNYAERKRIKSSRRRRMRRRYFITVTGDFHLNRLAK